MRIWQYLMLQKKSIKNDNKNENKIVNKIKNQIQDKIGIFNNIDNEISINLDRKNLVTKINNDQTKLNDLRKINDKQKNSNKIVTKNLKITKWNDQNDQYFKYNENQNNSSTSEIPLRIHNRKQQHKQRKHKFNYNKLSTLSNNRTLTNNILNNNQINDEYYQTKLDQQKSLSKIKNQKTNKFYFLQTNETTTIQSYLLTNSLIKLHRKVKRRKFNNQLNRHKLKRKRKDKLDDKRTYPSKTRLINNSTIFLLPILSTFKINQTIEFKNNLPINNKLINNQCNNCLSNIKALELKSDDNFYTTDSIINQNATNHQNNLEDLEESLKFAKNLMIAIYIIILFSVLLLLLRVIYIAIIRKLRRPGNSSNQQNSARHSSQLYTQNTFNQINYSNYLPGGNSNSNYNVSNCGGRSSEPNSISGGNASCAQLALGNLTNNLIAHNVQLNRNLNDDKFKKDNLENKIKHSPINQLNRSDSPASLNTIRPFSRQSGKFTDLNIVSDEFSSSVYVNDDEIK